MKRLEKKQFEAKRKLIPCQENLIMNKTWQCDLLETTGPNGMWYVPAVSNDQSVPYASSSGGASVSSQCTHIAQYFVLIYSIYTQF